MYFDFQNREKHFHLFEMVLRGKTLKLAGELYSVTGARAGQMFHKVIHVLLRDKIIDQEHLDLMATQVLFGVRDMRKDSGYWLGVLFEFKKKWGVI